MSEHRILETILERLNRIEDNTEKIMTTQAEFDAALDTLIAAEAARDAAITAALNDLIAKVSAGTVTPADFSAELAQVATLQANAAAITQTATTDDPGPLVVPTT
jgi:uncharacterized membrane protein